MPARKFAALILLCAVLGIAGPFIVVKYVLKPSTEHTPDKPVPAGETASPAKPSAAASVSGVHPDAPATDAAAPQPVFNPAFPITGVTMTGWVRRGSRILVTLSDGTTLNEHHAALQEVNGASFAVIAGRMVPMKPRERQPASVPVQTAAAPASVDQNLSRDKSLKEEAGNSRLVGDGV